MRKWKPIETGPKDGNFYIVGYFGKNEIDLAKWSDTNDGWACKYTGVLIRPDVWQPAPERPEPPKRPPSTGATCRRLDL